jgi:hypothetical protein
MTIPHTLIVPWLCDVQGWIAHRSRESECDIGMAHTL